MYTVFIISMTWNIKTKKNVGLGHKNKFLIWKLLLIIFWIGFSCTDFLLFKNRWSKIKTTEITIAENTLQNSVLRPIAIGNNWPT